MHHPIRDVETEAFNTAMQKELQRRLDIIAGDPPGVSGTFNCLDLLLAAVVALGLPWWVWRCLT